MSEFKNFYIFTGKGGVGKTTLALAFCEVLKKHKKKYLYISLKTNKLNASDKKMNKPDDVIEQLGINSEVLDLKVSVRGYIAKKLKSETVAKWIVKTPFFQSLVNMIPGFSYVIYLGYLLEKLTDDPELTIVLDSPSSGHALTMLESTKNFNEIFEGGVIYEDTKKMLEVLTSKSFTQINIITLPTTLAVNEALELESSIKSISPEYSVKITCNNCLFSFASNSQPDFLKVKISNEEEALRKNKDLKTNAIPHSLFNDAHALIKDLVPSVKNLV